MRAVMAVDLMWSDVLDMAGFVLRSDDMARTHKGRGRKRSTGRRGSAIPPTHTRMASETSTVSRGGAESPIRLAGRTPLRTRVRAFMLRLISFS